MAFEFKTGTLVEYRNRPWVVQQSTEKDLLIIKPLGGTDAETIGLYRPLYGDNLDIQSYNFKKPSTGDIGQNSYPSAARILYNACRLCFRDIAGPFQCLGKLSFNPRPYQLVPLILALKQKDIRLLISDDVGIGKTLESLLIAKELLDRREIDRFAVICLPHLCEQWQNEIKDKFGLDAEIIRSSTISQLEKKLRNDQNVFRDIPYQVISIDYIKQRDRIPVFLDHCPDFVIVDEAHTCARPRGANNSQQQRYNLLNRLSARVKHLILLTATPHSGQPEEFQSLIGLLKPEFERFELKTAQEREELSKYFIQRRRADIKRYLGDEVVFPNRVQLDNDEYNYGGDYLALLSDLIQYIKSGVRRMSDTDKRKQRYLYWDLLALMRGVMSSPDAGISMLQNKINKREDDSADDTDDTDERVFVFNDQLKDLQNADDVLPEAYETTSASDKVKFRSFIDKLEHIKASDADDKVKTAFDVVSFALGEKKSPIVFCQYIQTAEYVGNYIATRLHANRKTRNVEVGVITSRLSDEERKLRIDELAKHEEHVLVCTDCLSEGVNLQQGFDAVIHYDLPWNPNRMEQRDGRIDRFGQTASEVLVTTMHGQNNPVDKIVLNVLYKKQKEIKNKLGVYIPIADNDASLMETIMENLLKSESQTRYIQQDLFENDPAFQSQFDRDNEIRIKRLEENERISQTYFAHNNKEMDPRRMIEVLDEAKHVIGDVEDTCDFVVKELEHLRVNVVKDAPLCYSFIREELPTGLQHYFPGDGKRVKISFASPTPKGYMYIGRNHTFVDNLSRGVMKDTIDGGALAACRAMVLETDAVSRRTTVMLMRVRNVIRDKKDKNRELVGEEMIFFGYYGRIENQELIDQEECAKLFLDAHATGNLDLVSQRNLFNTSIAWVHSNPDLRTYTDEIAIDRARRLVTSFTQYRTYVAASEYQVVEPVLPMDVIAAYVFIPKPKV